MKTLSNLEYGHVLGGYAAIGIDTSGLDTHEVGLAAAIGAGVLGTVGLIGGTVSGSRPADSTHPGSTGIGTGLALGFVGAAIGATLGVLGSLVKQNYKPKGAAVIA